MYAVRFGESTSFVDRFAELIGGHVIGVRAELLVAPRHVARVGKRLPSAAELGHVDVLDPLGRERKRECFARKMRIATRAGIAADVGQAFDSVLFQQGNEIGEVAGGVSYRKKLLSH